MSGRFWALLFACLTILTSTIGARAAEPTTVDRPNDPAFGRIELKPCLLPAGPAMTPQSLLQSKGAFDCTRAQTSNGSGDFWVLMQGLNFRSTPTDPLRLRWASTWQDRVTLYFVYADGGIATAAITSGTTSRHLQLGAEIEIEIPPDAKPVTAILAYVEGATNLRGVFLSPRIETRASGDAQTLTLAAIYAACGGLGIALIVYNLTLWSALRLRFLLYYCGMVSATLLYGLSSSGFLAWMVPGLDNNDRLRLNYFLLALAGVGALIFIRHFFEDGIFPAWLRRTIAAVAAAILLSGSAFAILAPWGARALDQLYVASFAALIATLFPVMFCAWRAKSRYLGLFLLAWSAPIILAMLRTAGGLNLIPQNFWLDNSTLVATSIEALLSSLAAAYRIRALSQERDLAWEAAVAERKLADTDPLTGLSNRRAFLRRAIGGDDGSAGRQRLMLIDIDHFKQVNDRFGHDIGDDVLRRIAVLLLRAAGPDVMTARLGGEEFGMLSAIDDPGCDAELLLALTRAEPMPGGVRLTLSIGIAEGFIISEADWHRLYRRADTALYRAKRGGRDQICIWNEELGELVT